MWALGNIAGDSPQCRNLVLQSGALPPLLEQLGENQKVSMQRNATWTLSNFCRGKPPPDFTVVSIVRLCSLQLSPTYRILVILSPAACLDRMPLHVIRHFIPSTAYLAAKGTSLYPYRS